MGSNVVAPVGAGECVHQAFILEGAFVWRDPAGNYHNLQLVEDPLNAGVYIITDVEQSANVPTS